MKQGMTKRALPKDKHTTAWWKKRDEGRKGKQEAFAVQRDKEGDALTIAIEEGFLEQAE